MKVQDFSAPNWTQQYCSTHIGFCVSLHKNWYYKSFGTTTSYLWHIELSTSPVENLSDGPIVINLLSGLSASKFATDGQVRTQGDVVVGFRDWSANRHFEVIAPASLSEAVAYIVSHITLQPEE